MESEDDLSLDFEEDEMVIDQWPNDDSLEIESVIMNKWEHKRE